MPKKVKPITLKGIVKAIDEVTKELAAAKKAVPTAKPELDAKIQALNEIKASVISQCSAKKPQLTSFAP